MDGPWMIFDMDGVVTSEDGYWRAASCALLDFATRLGYAAERDAEEAWRLTPDLRVIARAKALLINTNWDLCHLAAIALAYRLPATGAQLRRADWSSDEPLAVSWPGGYVPDLNLLVAEIVEQGNGATGFALLEQLALKTRAAELFARKGPIWQWLFRHFQEWFNGRPGRPGIIENERLLRAPEQIAQALERLRESGWRLGIATGRTREELLPTLTRFGLLRFFEPEAVVTHDEVAQAEAALGDGAHLSKPHPFPFLRALYPRASAAELAAGGAAPAGTVIVGDTVADIAAAVTIGAVPVGVLTGPGGAAAEATLRAAGAAIILPDVTSLPDHYARAGT